MAGMGSLGTTISGIGLTIGNVVYINGPNITGTSEDITPIGSGVRYSYPGILDLGEVIVGLRYTASNSQSMLAELINPTVRVFEILYPDLSVAQFSGFINAYNSNVPEDGAIDAEITIKLSGESTPVIIP